MDDDAAIIDDHPAGFRRSFDGAFFLVLGQGFLDDAICQRIQHAAAGGGANNEIISKGSDPFQVQKEDIFPFFIFQGINDRMSKIQDFQNSPRFARLQRQPVKKSIYGAGGFQVRFEDAQCINLKGANGADGVTFQGSTDELEIGA